MRQRTHPVTFGSREASVWALPEELPCDVEGALALARELGAVVAVPGDGSTRELWEVLATLAAHDLGVARAVEPHLDAVAILRQAGVDGVVGSWGVFAAEGDGDPLRAEPDARGAGAHVERAGDDAVATAWRLTGTKPWCSLADRLDAALVTATTASGDRRLFAVDLHSDAVTPLTGTWHARGLSEIPSGPVRFEGAIAGAIGEPGWYLSRPGFEWGGIGVAACWYGGAVGIARTVWEAAVASTDAPANPFLLMHLGAIDESLQSARRALAEAAELADGYAGRATEAGSTEPRLLAKRVRATVARACEDVIARAGHALGPAPLALDERHAKRVADLTVYLRQHHAERDLQSLGRAVADSESPW